VGPIISEARDLEVAVGGDVAYAYCLRHMTGTKRGGEDVDLWFGAAACFRRERCRWRITHMHNSLPVRDGRQQQGVDLSRSPFAM
jgi:PhnB protein